MTDPLIVVTGSPAWLADLPPLLAGFRLMPYTDHAGYNPTAYITRLADDYAALVLVDGADPDWRFWTVTPRTSPATRRIPLLLITEAAEQRVSGLLAGADLVLSPADLLAQLSTLLADYARLPDPERAAQMASACAGELPDLARQGVDQFNAGNYYQQHDLFEALWVATPGPVRDLYRAILQVGIAYYQIERGNYRGALKMLLRSVQWFHLLPDTCQGLDVAQLRADSYRVRAELERLGEANLADFDRTLLQPVKFVSPPL